MLFHVSETPGIERFEPRPSSYVPDPVVWAIDADRLRNYLVPRECPRVTFYAGPETTAADVGRSSARMGPSSPSRVAGSNASSPAACTATISRRTRSIVWTNALDIS